MNPSVDYKNQTIMHKHKYLFLFVLFTLFPVSKLIACEISFKLPDEEVKVYNVDDILVVEVELVFTHRICPIALKDTKFTYEGVKILGATPWKEVSPMKYTRKLKIQITENKKNMSKISAIRSCDKEGGFGSIVIPLSE